MAIELYHPVLKKRTTVRRESQARILERSGWERADKAPEEAKEVSEVFGWSVTDYTPATGTTEPVEGTDTTEVE